MAGRRGGVEASGPARIAIVRLQWAIAWETFEEQLRGTPNFSALAQRGSSVGTAQWCVIHSTTGQNDVMWILSAATSAFEYQAAGTRRQFYPDDANLSLVGVEALEFPIPNPGRFRNYRDSWTYYAPAFQRVSVANVPHILEPSIASPNFGLCAYDVTASGGGQLERVRGAFSSGVSGGQAGYALTYTATFPNGLTRQTTETQAAWSIRYLTCDSGDNPQAIRGEPGCSNCGDRASLEPWA